MLSPEGAVLSPERAVISPKGAVIVIETALCLWGEASMTSIGLRPEQGGVRARTEHHSRHRNGALSTVGGLDYEHRPSA